MYVRTSKGIKQLQGWQVDLYAGLGATPEQVNAWLQAKFPSPFCPARSCFSERCLVVRLCPQLRKITYEPSRLALLLDNKAVKQSLLAIPTRRNCFQAVQYIKALESLLLELYGRQVALRIGPRN